MTNNKKNKNHIISKLPTQGTILVLILIALILLSGCMTWACASDPECFPEARKAQHSSRTCEVPVVVDNRETYCATHREVEAMMEAMRRDILQRGQ